MDLPGPPNHPPIPTPAPGSGLKWMLAILLVFAALAVFGQWERSRRSQIEKTSVLPPAEASSSPSPEESAY